MSRSKTVKLFVSKNGKVKQHLIKDNEKSIQSLYDKFKSKLEYDFHSNTFSVYL